MNKRKEWYAFNRLNGGWGITGKGCHFDKYEAEQAAKLLNEAPPLLVECPNNLLPDGPVCPKCGGRRGPSGIDGGSWVHY